MSTSLLADVRPCLDCTHDEHLHEHYSHTSHCIDCECEKFVPATRLRKILKKLGIIALVIFLALIMTVQI